VQEAFLETNLKEISKQDKLLQELELPYYQEELHKHLKEVQQEIYSEINQRVELVV